MHSRWVERDRVAAGWDLEGFVQWQFDDFRDLSDRRLLGGGSAWRYEKETENRGVFSSQLGVGLFYEEEERSPVANTDYGVRMNAYSQAAWDPNQHDSNFKLYGEFYLQPMIDSLNNTRAIGSLKVEVPILKQASVGLKAEIEHDSDPFPGVKETDTEYSVTFTYRFE